MSKADNEKLEKLHGDLATKLSDAIEDMACTDKGYASLLNVARQFLKDNHIEAIPASGSPLGDLAKKVAQFPFDPNEATSSH